MNFFDIAIPGGLHKQIYNIYITMSITLYKLEKYNQKENMLYWINLNNVTLLICNKKGDTVVKCPPFIHILMNAGNLSSILFYWHIFHYRKLVPSHHEVKQSLTAVVVRV